MFNSFNSGSNKTDSEKKNDEDQNGRFRIYVDTEYMYPGMSPKSGRPTESDIREIVQIGAILFDQVNGKEINSFNIMIKPTLIPNDEINNIKNFFFELTKLDENEWKNGETFSKALELLITFCKNHEIWTMDADWYVLKQNCNLHNIKFPFINEFIRVKPKLTKWNVKAEEYSSGTLYKAANINLDELHEVIGVKKENMKGAVHNALHDVRSMAAAVYRFEHLGPYCKTGPKVY